MADPWNGWLRQVGHDLVKRVLWAARDRRELGGAVRPGELLATLIDVEGNPATALAVWTDLRAVAPTPAHPALDSFAAALASAVAAAGQNDLAGVLALAPAFDRLTHDLARERR